MTHPTLGRRAAFALVAAAAVTATACSPTPVTTTGATAEPTALTSAKELTVVTHDSFSVPEDLLKKFSTDTGYELKFVAPGDGGALVNQLILTKDSPLGDVVFGIDNTFAGRALDEGVLSPYEAKVPAKASEMKADEAGHLTPIDFGDVCLNADKNWFAAKNLPIPETLDDLTKPEYKDLLVVTNPASSSPGLAFLAATVGAKGQDGYLDYWGQLKDNGVKVVKGWTEAYSVEFSGSAGKGPRPLVLSYATSPAFEVKDGVAPTVALPKTCFRQVEYAGVLKGAKNAAGARAFIDFLLSNAVQSSIPDTMYMYPVADVELPAQWVKFAPLSEKPITVSSADISANRDTWIKDWTAKVIG